MFLDTGTDMKARLVPRDLVTGEKNKVDETKRMREEIKSENDGETFLFLFVSHASRF